MTISNKLHKTKNKYYERCFIAGTSSLSKITYEQEEQSVAELRSLVESAGAKVLAYAIQKRKNPHPSTYLGSGKLNEIHKEIQKLDINLLVINDSLSGTQQMVIESMLNIKVLDRNAIILDVFASRAKTKEALLQVSLAQNEYLLPRLRGQWTHLERFSGGIGSRGPGETQLETDRRLVSKRISVLRKKIKKIYKHRDLMRNKRTKNSIPNVAIIGYTNAGKSSMMQALCKRTPTIADRPFETLDTTTGKIWVKDSLHYSITDTVGFFSNLPLELVAAFKATIEEIVGTDILLHVIDSSNDNIQYQIDSVLNAMVDLGIADKPILNILNKSDIDNQINTDDLEAFINSKFKNSLGIIRASAINKTGIDEIQKLLKFELFGITV